MSETTYFSEDNVWVTNTRFIAGGQTYAMSGVTAVKSAKQNVSALIPLIVLLPGGTMLLAGVSSAVLQAFSGDFSSSFGCALFMGVPGALLVALGIWMSKAINPTYYLLLTTASGEIKTLSGSDPDFINRVAVAVNDAIVARG